MNYRANPDRLTPTWYRDPHLAPEVYARIGAMLAEGVPGVEIARRVGVSERAISRYRARGGRAPEIGKTATAAKLTEEQVHDIRDAHEAGVSIRSLSREHQVSTSTISRAVHYQTWRNL